ncbi:LysR family transcriptional regulator [Companilactobacillus keshanensis]|uniref:LysR family transcriptional regulator n=1 Tax=Companilactobacillus keshanensis TaxID=2486003 RepID=A0ABW4BVA8_9LACO|nr:LysR family transcriptional regulator [Companilactobacillus keshanensis]
MNIKDLQYFQHVVKSQSFTQTASDYQVSQPTISQAIKRLEDQLQTKLIIRQVHSKTLILTPSGQQLLMTCNEVLSSWDNGLKLIERLKTSRIKLGIESSISERYFPVIAKKLLDIKLLNNVQVNEEGSKTLLKLVNDGDIDLAIIGTIDDINSREIITKRLKSFHFNILLQKDHPLLKDVSTLENVFKYNLVTMNRYHLSYQVFHEISKSFAPKVVFESDNTDLVMKLISDNNNLGFTSDLIELSDDLTTLNLPDKTFPTAYVSLVYRKNNIRTDNMENLIKIIEDSCR